MCQEVVLGQYLEMTAPHRENPSKEELLEVLRLKSGRYSVERPIALGALAAGARDRVLERLTAYGHEHKPTDVRVGVDNTLKMLGHKLKAKEIRLVREYQEDPAAPG